MDQEDNTESSRNQRQGRTLNELIQQQVEERLRNQNSQSREQPQDPQPQAPYTGNNTNPVSAYIYNEETTMGSIRASLGLKVTILILAAIYISGTGAQFVYNMLQGISTPLYNLYHFTTSQIHSIYTIYYAFNLFVSPLAGVLISKIGIRNGLLVFSTFIFVGVLVSYFGLTLTNFFVIQIGFVFTAIGNENLINCQVVGINKWFSGTILSFAMGLNFSYSYMIGALSDYLCPELFLEFRSVQVPFFVTGIAVFIGFMAAAGFNLITDKIEFEEIQEVQERESVGQEVEMKVEYSFRPSDLKKFTPLYWMTVAAYGLLYSCYTQFAHISTELAVRRFKYDYRDGKNFVASIKVVVLLLLPLWSYLVLRLGKKALILLISSIVATLAFSVMLLCPLRPSHLYTASIVLVGLFYSLYLSCIWPSLTLTLPKSAAAVGLGIASSAQMLCNLLFPGFIGMITRERDAEAYGNALIFLVGFSVLCVVFCGYLYYLDLRGEKVLDLPENSEKVKQYRDLLDMSFLSGSARGSYGAGTRLRGFSSRSGRLSGGSGGSGRAVDDVEGDQQGYEQVNPEAIPRQEGLQRGQQTGDSDDEEVEIEVDIHARKVSAEDRNDHLLQTTTGGEFDESGENDEYEVDVSGIIGEGDGVE